MTVPGSGSRAALTAIVIVGGGTTALSAAVALSQSVPNARIRVIVPREPEGAMADRAHTGLPMTERFRERIGMDEATLLTRAGATHRLACRYRGWGSDHPWFTGHGAAPDPVATGFVGQWAGHAAARDADRPANGPAAALAALGRFAEPVDDATSPLRDLDYALRVDPAAYLRLLMGLAQRAGVTGGGGEPVAVERGEDGRIDALRLASGESVAADLFIDCTGPTARLFALAGAEARIDWSGQLGCDRLMLPRHPAQPMTAPVDDWVAIAEGWISVSPGRDRTHLMLGYASAVTDDAAAGAALARTTGAEPGAIIPIHAGRLERPFVDNLVALGDAAASLEPLGWTNLHLAMAQIELLVELLPGRDIIAQERAEYNRRAGQLADRVRDYVAAHYAVATPPDGPFWSGWANRMRSDGLTHTLLEFSRRGRLPYFEEDSIPTDLWLQLLAGIGIPRGISGRALGVSPSELAAARSAHQSGIEAAIAAARPYPAWLQERLSRLSA
ncbi:tryptophan 7-halogenase [Sphingomonas sp. CJ99]